MTPWRLLLTPELDGPTNMAMDEAMLLLADQGLIAPTLRIYSWAPACVSLGYFQNTSQTVDVDLCAQLGLGLVRRLTGGGALYHDDEVTYSLAWPGQTKQIPSNIEGSYQTILQAIGQGLNNGLGAVLDSSHGAGSYGDEAFCLARSSCYDLTLSGKKVVGSAQRRMKNGFLQHGSILLGRKPGRLLELFGRTSSSLNLETIQARTIGLREALGHEISFDQASSSVVGGFESVLGVTLEKSDLLAHERGLVQRLIKEKYGLDSWNRRS